MARLAARRAALGGDPRDRPPARSRARRRPGPRRPRRPPRRSAGRCRRWRTTAGRRRARRDGQAPGRSPGAQASSAWDGRDRDVVRGERRRGVGLRRAVRRQAHRLGPDRRAGGGDGRVALPDVDAVGARGEGEIGRSLRSGSAPASSQSARLLGAGQQLSVGGHLVAQLEDVHAPASAAQHVAQGRPPGRRSHTKYSRALARRRRRSAAAVLIRRQCRKATSISPTGARDGRAERAARAADRQELIRVMLPAKRAQHTTHHPIDVAVLGGGVAGLAVAWRARARGLTVCVLDRGELGAGTSRVAAGMLAPVTEADAGERPLLALGLRQRSPTSLPNWRRRPASRSATGAAARSSSRATATRPRRWTASSRCAPPRAGGRAPAAVRRPPGGARAAPTVRLALDVPDDHAVDPRLLTAALARAAGLPVRSCARAWPLRASCTTGRACRGWSWSMWRAPGRTASSWRPARGRASTSGCRRARESRCAPSRARPCGCAIPPALGC